MASFLSPSYFTSQHPREGSFVTPTALPPTPFSSPPCLLPSLLLPSSPSSLPPPLVPPPHFLLSSPPYIPSPSPLSSSSASSCPYFPLLLALTPPSSSPCVQPPVQPSPGASPCPGSAAHHCRPHWEPPTAAGLHHSHDGPGSVLLPAQQPQPRHCAPPPGCRRCCRPPPHPAPPLHLHGACGPGLHRHRGPPGGLPRLGTPHRATHCLPGQHRPPGPREHGPPGPALAHHPPESVSSPVCPPDLHQRLSGLHSLHWIPTEPRQGQPVPVHIDTGRGAHEGGQLGVAH